MVRSVAEGGEWFVVRGRLVRLLRVEFAVSGGSVFLVRIAGGQYILGRTAP